MAPKPIFVKWLDHCSYTETNWKDTKSCKSLSPVRVSTMGWLIKETKKYIVVVNHLANNGKNVDAFCILKGAIIERKYI